MLTANEARQMADQKYTDKYLKEIEDGIKENISYGRIFWHIPLNESQRIIDYLKTLGYMVDKFDEGSDGDSTELAYITISW